MTSPYSAFNTVPNPTNTKSVILRDRQGGTDHNMPAFVLSGNTVVVPQLQAGSILPFGGEQLLSITPLVNLNTASETNLYSAPTSPVVGLTLTNVIITKVIVHNASTSLTTASIAFGWNAGTDNDWAATATYTALTGATLFQVINPKSGAKMGVPGGVFSVIPTIQQGAAATCTIAVFGYFV